MSTVYQKQLVIEKETDYILGLNALVCSGYSSHEEHIRVKVKHDIRLAISEVDAHAWWLREIKFGRKFGISHTVCKYHF